MSVHAKIFLLIFLSLGLTTNIHALRLYKPEKYEAARARAVEVARQGDHEAALKSFERLIKLEPDNPGARYDYITVLVWDRQYAAAVEQYRQISPALAPEYVLRSLVIASERAGQPDINSQLVKTYMQRFSKIPEDTPANISGKSYRELINDEAHNDMPITSLNILKNLLKDPHNQDVLGDYIVALSRNGQHAEAVKLQGQLDLANAPKYVISALLYSSYELGQTENQNKLKTFYDSPDKAQATDKPEKYEAARARAVEVARQGDLEAALKSFERLIKLEPDNPGARYDYITVLVWDRQYAAAVEQYRQISPALAPEYVLRSLVIASERAGQPDINSQLVKTYMQRFSKIPEDTPANISGKSYREWLNDEAHNDMPITSLNILKNLLKDPHNQDVLGDYIVALSRNGQHAEAVKLQGQLDLANAQKYVISALLYSSYELGQTENQNKLKTFYDSPGKAQATDKPDKKTERATVPDIGTTQPLDLMAQQLRWTQLYSPDPELSRKDLDELVSRYADFENSAVKSTPEIYRQWLSDYIVALHYQGDYEKIILVYENRKLSEIQPADYALQNVAGAYLQIRQPGTAITLYSSLLEHQPDNQALHSGLFYAYSDSHDYEAAFEIANAQVAKIGQWRKDHSGAVVKPNEERLAAEIMLVNAYAYQDDLQQARKKLHRIIDLAPYNAELHENLSTLYRWSEWPQQALQEANIANTIEPDNISGRIAQTYALMDLYEYEAVEKQRDFFERPYFNGNAAVGKLKRDWQQHQKRELYSRLELGWTDVSENQSVQNSNGSADQSLETYLYDKPYSLYMRPYVHQYFAQADFEEGTDRYERLGAGMHWRKQRHNFRLGLNGSYNGASDIGISLAGDYALDDYWSVAYGFNSFSTDVSLRAYFQDISGSDYNLGLRYRKDPLQAVSAGISYLDFSDGNERLSSWINYEWRNINRPTYKMTLVPSVYASNNSQTGGPYFSPENDLSVSLGLRNVWTTRQNYDAFLKPHLDLEVGLYDQSGYDTKTNLLASYWHEQSFDRDLSMEYGVRWSRKYYDGQPENHSALFAVLNWRF